jgi:hypothetical protein
MIDPAAMGMTGATRFTRDALADVWSDVGGATSELANLRLAGRDPALPSVFHVTTAAAASIAAATLGAAGLLADRNDEPLRAVDVDSLHAVVAFRSERHVRPLDGVLDDLWDPLAGDYRAADGWIRLHTNYAHHRAAALRVLAVAPDRAAVASAVAQHAPRSSRARSLRQAASRPRCARATRGVLMRTDLVSPTVPSSLSRRARTALRRRCPPPSGHSPEYGSSTSPG